MTGQLSPRQRSLLIVVCALPVIGLFFVSAGLFTIDELIYLTATVAMAQDGSLIFENGFSQFGSEDLKLWFLVDGPNGLAPQYPPGMAVLSAPFYLLMGSRGLIMLNALAAAGVAFLTYRLAWRLYRSRVIALISTLVLVLGTFFLEYAWGVWPHMVSAFFVTAAFHLAIEANEAEQSKAVLARSFGSGLAVGAGMLVRTDAILVLPVIAACLILYSKRPIMMIAGGACGLIPGIAAGALVNLHKFGTLNFLSYGRTGSGGGDDPTTHIGAALIVLGLLLGLVVARHLTWSARWYRPSLLAFLGLLGIALLVPAVTAALRPVALGLYSLLVDIRTVADSRSGVKAFDDGAVVLFWGVAKKALAQSLPWLGILAAILVSPWPREYRPAHVMLLIFIAIWCLPFIALSWHGGFSSNMRYFLPMLPPLSIFCGVLIGEFASLSRSPLLSVLLGVATGIVGSLAIILVSDMSLAWLQQSGSLSLFLAIALVVAIASLANKYRQVFSTLTLFFAGIGLGAGFFNGGLLDVAFSQLERQRSETFNEAASKVVEPALFYGAPKLFAFAVARPESLIGVGGRLDDKVDTALISDALAAGYRVIMPTGVARRVAELHEFAFETQSSVLSDAAGSGLLMEIVVLE